MIKTLNERLKSLRKSLGLTQQKFADQLGVKRNTVGQWECGINPLTDQTVFSICRVFNVNEEWLRTGTGEMFVEIPEEDAYSRAAASIFKDDDAVAIEALKLYYTFSPDEKKAVKDYILRLSDMIQEHEKKKE